MSLYNDASLAMIPSAVKDGKLYSIRPTDGSGDFTFSRGSNLAATRVDVNGLIEKGRENLLLQSNQFDTTWVTSNASVTSGQTGYDGSSDAWRLNALNTSSVYIYQGNFSTLRTQSIYAKAGTADQISIIVGGYGQGVQFDLTNGTIVTNSNTSIYYPTIVPIGATGWYRISVFIAPSAPTYSFLISPEFVGSGGISVGEYIYIQDAQLEVGLVATDYIETTTTTAVSGITEDLPRLDYSGGASCPSLLLEPTRTNLLTHSEYFGVYTLVNSSIETNAATSPEGVINASKLISTSGASRIETFPSVTDNTIYTASAFVKKGNVNFAMIGWRQKDGTGYSVFFNLETGEIGTNNGNVTADIESYGDYYRISLTENVGSGTTTPFRLQYLVANADGNVVTNSGDFIYIYGTQLEEGYPSSYIPSYGSAVTRSKDSMTLTDLQGNGIYPSLSEGTLFYDLEVTGKRDSAALFRHIRLVDNIDSSTNRIRIWEGSAGVLSTLRVDFNGTYIEQSFFADTPNKIAVSWGDDGTKIIVNGVVTDTSATQLIFASTPKFLTNILSNYHFKQIVMFPTALTDSECIALTTL